MTTTTTSLPVTLEPGDSIEKLYWGALMHYGFVEVSASQAVAEDYARKHPTQIETLSYEDQAAGVIPAGTGFVELRVRIAFDGGGSIDTPLLRYSVTRPRKDPR